MLTSPDSPNTEKSLFNNEIIGDVILGDIDPRSLNKNQVLLSEGCLYHGSGKEFTYSSDGEFDSDSAGTADYGEGIYTTNNLSQAENYSIVRQYKEGNTHPIVTVFLPFKARMLDVRRASNPDCNGALSMKFVREWIKYLQEVYEKDSYIPDTYKGNDLYEDAVRGLLEKAIKRVQQAVKHDISVSIRVDGNNHPGIFDEYSNGVVDRIFRQFILNQGYDGIIYNEFGEGQNRERLTGFVFYNYQKIDTWEGWQNRLEEQK